jgi:hypothetical protein
MALNEMGKLAKDKKSMYRKARIDFLELVMQRCRRTMDTSRGKNVCCWMVSGRIQPEGCMHDPCIILHRLEETGVVKLHPPSRHDRTAVQS